MPQRGEILNTLRINCRALKRRRCKDLIFHYSEYSIFKSRAELKPLVSFKIAVLYLGCMLDNHSTPCQFNKNLWGWGGRQQYFVKAPFVLLLNSQSRLWTTHTLKDFQVHTYLLIWGVHSGLEMWTSPPYRIVKCFLLVPKGHPKAVATPHPD